MLYSMTRAYLLLMALACLAPAVQGKVYPLDANGQPVPGSIQTFYIDPENMWLNRQLYQSGRKELNPAINRMIRIATEAVEDPTTYTVIAKPSTLLPPSNDPHDFYSLARYYWPNPNATNGIYIRQDGQVNPEIFDLPDSAWLTVVIQDVWSCGLAYFYTGNETFVGTGLKRLRDWFINPDTKMNPNLNYAAWIKGSPPITNSSAVTAGPGLLDLSQLYMLVDGMSLLRVSANFPASDEQAMNAWFTEYLRWLQTSPRGRGESTAINNQGTWYDVQLLTLFLQLGDSWAAASLLQTATIPRLAAQIMPDGSMPLEQARTLSWHYSNFAVDALFVAGYLAMNTNVSLFGYQTSDGRSVQRAVDYLVPYALAAGGGWPVPNSGNFSGDEVVESCKEAYLIYRDQKYLDAANQLQAYTPQTWNPMRLWAPYNVFDVPLTGSAPTSPKALPAVLLSAAIVIGFLWSN
ncbi:hypothetical protein HDV00_004925 [Rhizophlyctis rosea]|nr:hypothetical protein HDV00_004925 [Rhizophlyctis rosea]